MMKKKTVRIISCVVAAVLVLAMVMSILTSGISFAGAADADELKDKLSSLQEEKAEIKKTLEDLEQQKAGVEKTRAALQSEINVTKTEIETVEQYIERLQGQIDIKAQELDVAEKALEEKEEKYSMRVRKMYEQGESSYLEVLLNATSFSNIISRFEFVSQIMDYDKRVVTEYTEAKDDIAQKKEELQTTQNEQKSYQENLNYKAKELAANEAQQAALQESIESYSAAKKEEQDRLDAEMSSVSSEIAELSRESAASGGTIVYSGDYVWPTPSCTTTNSRYGWRLHPIYGDMRFHAGEDIPAGYGAQILATASGTVRSAGWVGGYGNYTVIDHGGGVMSAYGHQSSFAVSAGQYVEAGQVIGYVGSTGNSTGPHLHFEIYVNGSTVDPKNYF